MVKRNSTGCNGTARHSRSYKSDGIKMKGSSGGNSKSRHQHNLREAEKRLANILKNVETFSVSPADLTNLASVKKITDTTGYTRWTRHIWGLLIALATVFIVLLACSVEDHALSCIRNTSDAAVAPPVESSGAPAQTSPSTSDTVHGHSGQGEEEDTVNSHRDGWVQSSEQLVRRER